MPKLPSAQDIVDGRSTNPTRQIAGYQTGAMESAAKAIGAAVSGVGREFDEMYAREKERTDNLLQEDALNKLRNRQLDRTYGEGGFTKIKGGDVLSRPVLKEYPEVFRKDIDEIAIGIKSPEAQAKFRERASGLATSFSADVYRHVMAESDRHADSVFAGTIETETNYAAQNWNRPDTVGVSLARANQALAKRFDEQGITDPNTQKAMRQKYLGGLHSAVMGSALASKDYQYAAEYLKSNESDMDAVKVKTLRSDIDVLQKKSAEEEAGRTAIETARYVYDAYLPGSDSSGIDTAGANKAIETAMKGLPPEYTTKALSLFDNMVKDRENTITRKARETKGSLLTQFNQDASRKNMMAIYGSGDFLALPTAEQGELSGYMERLVESRENRAETEARMAKSDARVARNEAKAAMREWETSPEVMAAAQNIMDRDDFFTMSEAELRSFETSVGRRNITTILNARRRDMDKAQRFKFDSKLYNDSIPKEILKNKDKINAYGGTATLLLEEWRQQHPGKVPTPQEQVEILKGALEDWKVIDGGMFGIDVNRPRYEAQGQEGAVPKDLYDRVSAAGLPTNAEFAKFYAGAVAEARRRKQTFTDDALINLWRKKKGMR